MKTIHVPVDCSFEFATSLQLQEYLANQDILFDCSECQYMASSFIGLMIYCSKRANIKVYASTYVYKLLDRVGLTDILEVWQ